MELKELIRIVPDFPQKNINFIDITTMLKNPLAFRYVVDHIVNINIHRNITKVVTLESRGFIVGGAVAYQLNAGFVPIRKKGKLPADVFSKSYELEYGIDTIEIHKDSLIKDDIVLLHDDLLATGGTAVAALDLIKSIGVKEIYLSFICGLDFIQSKNKKYISKFNPDIIVSY